MVGSYRSYPVVTQTVSFCANAPADPISDEYNPALKDFRKLVSNSWKVASRAYKLESSEEFSIIFRKELTSNIVNKLCKDINIIDNENGFEELGFKSHKNYQRA